MSSGYRCEKRNAAGAQRSHHQPHLEALDEFRAASEQRTGRNVLLEHHPELTVRGLWEPGREASTDDLGSANTPCVASRIAGQLPTLGESPSAALVCSSGETVPDAAVLLFRFPPSNSPPRFKLGAGCTCSRPSLIRHDSRDV